MQFQACLLLLIVSADTALALSRHPCGGNVTLDQHLAGRISLILSEPFSSTNTTIVTLNSTSDQSNKTLPLSVCTWMISIPPGRTVLFKLLWLESGSSATVRCLGNDHVLETDGSTLLSNCGGHKASLSWTGEGHSSNPIELSYYVQEDERNSTGEHAAGSRTDTDLVHQSQTGTSFTSLAPVAREAAGGTEWGEGEWTSGPSPSSQDRGLLHATSHPQRSTLAGNADRETLSLPEEGQNNGADTSGVTHRTDGSIYTPAGSHPYFEPTRATDSVFDTSHPTKTQTDSSEQSPEIQTLLKLGTASTSNATMVTDVHKLRDNRMFDSSATQKYQTVPSSRTPNLTSNLPDILSWGSKETGSVLVPQGGAVSSTPKETLHFSWRGQRSTDRLNSELTAAITHNPSPSPPEQQQEDSSREPTGMKSTTSSSSLPEGSGTLFSSTAAPTSAPHHMETASLTRRRAQNATDAALQSNDTEAPDGSEDDEAFRTFTLSTPTRTDSPERTESTAHFTTASTPSPVSQASEEEPQTAASGTQRESVNTNVPIQTATSDGTESVDTTRPSVSTATDAGPVLAIQNSATTEPPAGTKAEAPIPTYTGLNELLTTNLPTSSSRMSSRTTVFSLTPSHTAQTHSPPPDDTFFTRTSSPSPFTTTQSPSHVTTVSHRITSQKATVESASSQTLSSPPSPSSSRLPVTHNEAHDVTTPELPPVLPVTTASSERNRQHVAVTKEYEPRQGFTSSVNVPPSLRPEARSTLQPRERSLTTPTASLLTTTWSSTSRPKPKFYIVPDQPADIKVKSIELLLQIIVEETKPASANALEEDTAVWVKSHLQRAPGFSRLLEVWSSGHAVQCLAEFKTSAALQWLGMSGPASLLEQTGLAEPGASFTSARIVNVTLGGVQADVCDWLMQCQAGFKCTAQRGSSNYSCSSDCHFDFCHHHGICTHHPGQLPLCHCQAGEDTWYMGQKCDVRMTRARLVAACLAVLLVMGAVIGVLAFLAVRRYRALLIQAKVDQTRSSYRRFNHFDELSGRFWLRSWAESADSLDNPAFTRSDELLHLRALDRPCCYHDDTLSLASTCPSHGARINTIYPHSSQYAWRGSEMSVGDGVLDSGKASDLSVCSWPVEPIQWTPFPLLQQLASHRAPANQVRVSRPRSYCEGMELVDMGKSWTA